MNNNLDIIYFDNASKTIPYPEVVDKYNELLANYANPSSIHLLGRRNARLLDQSKEELLSLLKLNNHQVIYLSSATEANNLAIKGFALKYKNRGKHIITTSYEHASVLESFEQLKNEFGFEVTYVNPDDSGVVSVDKIKEAIRNDTILVSVMAVNNEIGSVNPIEDIAKLLKQYPKIAFHVDACQAIGKLEKEINYSDVDMFSVSSHKLHGIIGSAALIKKKGLELLPLLSGGGQEYNYRSSTVDLAGSLAMVEAIKISFKNRKNHFEKVKELHDKLEAYINEKPNIYALNSTQNVNPYIVNFSTINKKSSVVVEALSNLGIMVSSISACHSSKEKGSHVVKAIGKSDNLANNTIRVSFSYLNTSEEVDKLIASLDNIIGAIR